MAGEWRGGGGACGSPGVLSCKGEAGGGDRESARRCMSPAETPCTCVCGRGGCVCVCVCVCVYVYTHVGAHEHRTHTHTHTQTHTPTPSLTPNPTATPTPTHPQLRQKAFLHGQQKHVPPPARPAPLPSPPYILLPLWRGQQHAQQASRHTLPHLRHGENVFCEELFRRQRLSRRRRPAATRAELPPGPDILHPEQT